jgi:hypothetical protein
MVTSLAVCDRYRFGDEIAKVLGLIPEKSTVVGWAKLPGTADTVSEVGAHFAHAVTPAKYDRVGNAPICRAFSDVPAGRVAHPTRSHQAL